MTYDYPYSGITSFEAIEQALPASGVFDAVTSLDNGYITVETTIGTEPQVDAAVALAVSGGLFSNKTLRINDIGANTAELSEQGVMIVRPSDGATVGPIELSYDSRSRIKILCDDISSGLVVPPQIIDTTDGRGFIIFTSADCDAVYQAIIYRGVYLLGVAVNGDGSVGENGMIQMIIQAVDQSALDAIVDTRV
jgi:hypothetical protein